MRGMIPTRNYRQSVLIAALAVIIIAATVVLLLFAWGPWSIAFFGTVGVFIVIGVFQYLIWGRQELRRDRALAAARRPGETLPPRREPPLPPWSA